jgi:hypothetical protein
MNQHSESLERPADVWTNQSRKKKQEKITTKQLITLKMQSPNQEVRSGSEHGFVHSSSEHSRSNKSFGKQSRSGSIDQLGFCYYHKKHS